MTSAVQMCRALIKQVEHAFRVRKRGFDINVIYNSEKFWAKISARPAGHLRVPETNTKNVYVLQEMTEYNPYCMFPP